MTGLVSFVVVLSYFIIALTVITKTQGGRKKLIALAIFVLIPSADTIVGHLYFRYLCLVYSGQFIYKTVTVEEPYLYKPGEMIRHKLNKEGTRLAIAEGGEINREKLRERYDFPTGKHDKYSRIFFIKRITYKITDKVTGELLSKSVSFHHEWGWLFNLYPHGPQSYCCEDQKPTSRNYIHGIFEKTFVAKAKTR